VIAFIVVAMGAVFAWGYSAYFAAPTGSESGGGAIPTATALNDEDRFIATNTPAPPTSTPQVSVRATEEVGEGREDSESGDSPGRVTISYPTITTTADTVPVDGVDSGGTVDEGSADDGEGIEASGENRSYSFFASAELDLLIVVDNVIVWQSPLGEGQSTGYLTGTSFVVSISGADSIAVLDGDGNETIVEGPEFTLP
jgi:hypothetical protein